MTPSFPSDELQSAWQDQVCEPFKMTSEAIHAGLATLDKKIQKDRRRRFVGYGAGLLVMASFFKNFLNSVNTLERIGAGMTILGAGYLIYQLQRARGQKSWSTLPDAQAGSTFTYSYYRTALERMRDFHRGRLFWTRLAIFLPGPLVFITGFTAAHPEEFHHNLWVGALLVTLGALAIPLNLWMARRYQRRIDELDTLQKEQ